jgi:carbonic anhydrase
MQPMNELLAGNIKWVEDTLARDPHFFDELATGQSPEYLWIGCSDSRVPASEITGQLPGSIFVQRNIANQVHNTDINLLSVVYYAVKYLKVKHILVVGHYGCGGVLAAMSNNSFGFLDNWLVNIKNVYSKYQDELDAIEDEHKRGDRLVELNVVEQVRNLAKVSFIQEEWDAGEVPQIHGLVYSLSNGRLVDLEVSINSNSKLRPVFKFNY